MTAKIKKKIIPKCKKCDKFYRFGEWASLPDEDAALLADSIFFAVVLSICNKCIDK